MHGPSNVLSRVTVSAIAIIIPLVAATWLIPADFPMLLRQILLCVWGVGATLAAERLLVRRSLAETRQAIGFVPARASALVTALLVSVPMWVFLPLFAWFNGIAVAPRPDWLALLIGAILVNGVAE